MGLLAYVDSLMVENARTPDPLPKGSLLLWLMDGGIVLSTVALVASSIVIALRIDWHTRLILGAAICLFLIALAGVTFWLSRAAMANQTTPWLHFTIGVTAIPILIGWVAASGMSYAFNPRPNASTWQPVAEKARAQRLLDRQALATSPGWQTPARHSIDIGLLLSGGGYRAAVVHAGLLKALDEHCVPIRYLSTVSGGSIIGTFYALGYTPEQFKDLLTSANPGLPDNIMNILFVFLEAFLPII